MLSILHKKINNIVEIIGLDELPNNGFNIQYKNPSELTSDQIVQIGIILQSWPLDQAKLNKIELLDNKWKNQVEAGFDTIYGWKLGLTNNDVTLLTGAFLLAKEASNMGLSSEAVIMDTEGVSHNIQVEDLTMLMLQYGQYRSSLSSSYSSTKQLIENCTSIQQVENIQI